MSCPHCHGEAAEGTHGAGVCVVVPSGSFKCIRCLDVKPAAAFYLRRRNGKTRPTGACRECKHRERVERHPSDPLKVAAWDFSRCTKGTAAEQAARAELLRVASEARQ